MLNDLISIVLPIYNGEIYMRESIESIIKQTYTNWELLIIDDCSTDNTAKIAKEYVQKDKRIKYYKNEKNMKLPKTLNYGFSLTKGNFLTWTSDDNIFKDNALEMMYEGLQKSKNAQFIYASCEIIDSKGNNIGYMGVSEDGKKRIVGQNVVGACFMYTRKVYKTIGDYDYNWILVEDFDYWQRIFSKFEVACIEEVLYLYRVHENSLTSTEKKDIINGNCEEVILKNLKSFGKLTYIEKYYLYNGLNKCRKNMIKNKNKYLIKYLFYSAYFYSFYKIPLKMRKHKK